MRRDRLDQESKKKPPFARDALSLTGYLDPSFILVLDGDSRVCGFIGVLEIPETPGLIEKDWHPEGRNRQAKTYTSYYGYIENHPHYWGFPGKCEDDREELAG